MEEYKSYCKLDNKNSNKLLLFWVPTNGHDLKFLFWKRNSAEITNIILKGIKYRCNTLTHQYFEDIIRCFSFNINTINFTHLIPYMDQPWTIGSPSMHNTRNNNFSSFLICFYCCTLTKKLVLTEHLPSTPQQYVEILIETVNTALRISYRLKYYLGFKAVTKLSVFCTN